MGSSWVRPALASVAAATLLASIARSARADDAPERPIVQAIAVTPDVCFDGNSLAQSIAAWLKKGTIDARIAILIRRPNADNVRFTVERGEKLVGERDLPVGTLPCPDLRAALALAISIAIDNTLLESLGIQAPETAPTERETAKAPAPPPRPVVEKKPVAPPPPPPPKPKPPPAKSKPARGLSFALEAEALFGILPGPALGAAPRVGFSPARFLDIRVGALGTTRAQTSLGGGIASASLLAGRLDVCGLGPASEVRGALCAGFAGGSLDAEGSGLAPSFSTGLHWAAVTARVEARYPANSRLAAVASVDGIAPVLRPELQVVDKKGQIVDSWRSSLIGFGVTVGADLVIW